MKKNLRIVDLCQDLKNKTAKKVQHLAINCPFQNRISALADILICYGGVNGKTIVFTQTKADCNALILTDKIKQDIEVMHGDIAQNQREVTMKRFKEGKFQVLCATDVASRGLDIPNVDLVIQIEPPKEAETYIHRSGRTARAGASGTCITFYTNKTKYLIEDIELQAGIKF
jgi:ATP-dependent RNA helicase DDX21